MGKRKKTPTNKEKQQQRKIREKEYYNQVQKILNEQTFKQLIEIWEDCSQSEEEFLQQCAKIAFDELKRRNPYWEPLK